MTKNTRVFRSILVLLAIGLATPALAQSARRPPPPPSSSQAVRMGPLFGLEWFDGDAGLALRGDAQMPLSRLSPTVTLDGVLSVGLSFIDIDPADADLTIFRMVPALRLNIPVAPTVGVYGDFGLGLYYANLDVNDAFFDDRDDDDLGIAMRFAGGLFADVSPAVRLGGELGLNPHVAGDLDETTVTLLFSAMFRL
jgi:hypothetical protein